MRSAGGPTRRANSANPLHVGADASDALVDEVEAFYAAQGRPTIFRIPDMMAHMDAVLAARGYRRAAPTRTLFGALRAGGMEDAAIRIDPQPTARWLDARDRLSGASAADAVASRAIMGAITLPSGFAGLEEGGEIVSLAFGVVQGDVLVLESVMTDPAYRRTGCARRCIGALARWAKGQGARHIALQMMTDNQAALCLYESLDISRDLYGYHYRIVARP